MNEAAERQMHIYEIEGNGETIGWVRSDSYWGVTDVFSMQPYRPDLDSFAEVTIFRMDDDETLQFHENGKLVERTVAELCEDECEEGWVAE